MMYKNKLKYDVEINVTTINTHINYFHFVSSWINIQFCNIEFAKYKNRLKYAYTKQKL